jgi:hypothetical protein
MNDAILNQFKSAIRYLQGISGESLTIAGVDYPCTPADSITGQSEFVQGGRIDKNVVPVAVMKDDLPIEPAVDTMCVFRGDDFRIFASTDSLTYWLLTLVQPIE